MTLVEVVMGVMIIIGRQHKYHRTEKVGCVLVAHLYDYHTPDTIFVSSYAHPMTRHCLRPNIKPMLDVLAKNVLPIINIQLILPL